MGDNAMSAAVCDCDAGGFDMSALAVSLPSLQQDGGFNKQLFCYICEMKVR